MNKPITSEMIAAWRTLQAFAERNRHNTSIDYLKEAAHAIDVLDNSDYMVPIEEAEEEVASPVLGESPDLGAPHGRGKCPHCGHPRVPLTAEGLTMYHGDVKSGQGDCLGSLCSPEQPLDPAEWGDTTREDMARHQREAAILAAGGEVHMASIPLSELTGEGLARALREGKDSTN